MNYIMIKCPVYIASQQTVVDSGLWGLYDSPWQVNTEITTAYRQKQKLNQSPSVPAIPLVVLE